MKAEEEDVDVDTTGDETHQKPQFLPQENEDDEWADLEPDDDCPTWKMKIILEANDTLP